MWLESSGRGLVDMNPGCGWPDGGLGRVTRTPFPFHILTSASWSRQVEVQCLLLLEVLGGSHKHAVAGAVKKLTKLWKEVTGGSRGGGHRFFRATPGATWRICFAFFLLRTLAWWSSTYRPFSAWNPTRAMQACWGCWCSSARATRRWTWSTSTRHVGSLEGGGTWFCRGGPSCWPRLELFSFLTQDPGLLP